MRIYGAGDNAFREIRSKGTFLNCSGDDNGRLIVTEKGEEDFSFVVYDINGIEKQQVKGEVAANADESEKAPVSERTDVSEVTDEETGKTPKSHIIKNVPIFSQKPEYPTGCETVSTVMALRYAGYNISAGQFIEKYLPQSSSFKEKDGVRYGPDPNKTFIGTPSSAGGYGCFAPVIAKALSNCLGEKGAVINATGNDLEELCKTYVSRNMPVITWVTISMMDTYPSAKWCFEDGTDFTWPANEHCMLLIGYDGESCYFNDPYVGKTVKYSKELAEKRYDELGKQAVVIANKVN